MSSVTVSWLAGRITKAESRWDAAMAHPQYRDDPEDPPGTAFTPFEQIRWNWAHNWRLCVHELENELDRLPEAATARAQHLAFSAQNPTYAEPMHTTEAMHKMAPIGTAKTPPKPKTIRRDKPNQ